MLLSTVGCSDSELTSDIELSKPAVRQALRDQSVVEGESACLQCTITGVPEPEVIWYYTSCHVMLSRLRMATTNSSETISYTHYSFFELLPTTRYHNSKPIKESKDYKFVFEGDRCSLIILHVANHHQGSYRCKALNPAGEASSTCKVKVTSERCLKNSYASNEYTI